jgi:hypothetical protein
MKQTLMLKWFQPPSAFDPNMTGTQHLFCMTMFLYCFCVDLERWPRVLIPKFVPVEHVMAARFVFFFCEFRELY